MYKPFQRRLVLAALSAITVIPIVYTLVESHGPVEGAAAKPVDVLDGSARKRQVLVHHCGGCDADHSLRPTLNTSAYGMIWETSDHAVESMRITNGMPLAKNYRPESAQRLVLEDGTELALAVTSRFVHQDGTVAVDAVVAGNPGQPEGRLHIQWNDTDGFFLGQIEYTNHPVAYEISRNDSGETMISRRSIDQLVCAEVDAVTKEVNYGLPGVDQDLAGADLENEADEAPAGGGGSDSGDDGMDVPALSSYPSAEAVIYLDFNGELVKGTSWGTNISAASTGYSAAKITAIWQRVAADMEPFNLNVTTEEAVFLSAPSTRRIRCIITPSNEWYISPSVGGVAKRSSFTWSGDTPCWVFSDNLADGTKYVAECCSHEIGHTLGLTHDGKTGTTYYQGHGSGAVGWAPIMGNGYHKSLTQWSKGEYSSATNTQDDLSIIASSTNGFGYRSDDHGDNRQGATVVANNASNQVSAAGVIETRGDEDVFELTSGAGSISVAVAPAGAVSNLDIEVELYDDRGNLLVVDNPSTLLNASISTTVQGGTYYLHVKATGYGTADTGSTDYASLGAYSVSGEMAADKVPTPYEVTVADLPAEEQGLSDDPDGDGLNNLAEHVLGTNPSVADSEQNFTSIDPKGATGVEFLIDLPEEIPSDALYTVEATCDLSDNSWTGIASRDTAGNWSGTATVVEEAGPNGKQRFRITDGSEHACRFMRVRFELDSAL